MWRERLHLTIDRTVRFGDILTTFSIIISVAAVLLVGTQDSHIRQQDSDLRQREQADKVRNAAAQTLGKLERWEDLSLWMFKDVESLFVETSELLEEDYDPLSTRAFYGKVSMKLERGPCSEFKRRISKRHM